LFVISNSDVVETLTSETETETWLKPLQPQTCGLIYKFRKEMHGHWKCWQRLVWRVYAFFTRKMSVNQLNIRGVCRSHASINVFRLRKILIVLFVTKQYQPFCVRTGGDALMKDSCSGLLPVLKWAYVIWESGEEANHCFLFWNKHSRCRRVYTAPAPLVK